MQLLLNALQIDSLSGQSLLNIEQTEFSSGVTALTGANGAGKSTLLKVLATVNRFKDGLIELDGVSLADNRKEYLRNTCYMPQNFSAYPELSGFKFLKYLLSLHGATGKTAKDMTEFWLRNVGLQNSMHNPTGTYSQGMLQKLGFAFAIAVNKSLTIMDEPFAGVDPEGRALLMDIMFDEQFSNRIFIVCTHHVDEMQQHHAVIKKIVNGGLINVETKVAVGCSQ